MLAADKVCPPSAQQVSSAVRAASSNQGHHLLAVPCTLVRLVLCDPLSDISHLRLSATCRILLEARCNQLPESPCDSLQDLRAALATRRLQDAVGQTASNQLFILQAPTTVARVSVCGNQVCEHGERPTNGTANGGELAAGCSRRLSSPHQRHHVGELAVAVVRSYHC